MLKPLGALSLLLLTSALVSPSMAFAQSAEPAEADVNESVERSPESNTVDAAEQPAEVAVAPDAVRQQIPEAVDGLYISAH